MSQCKIYLENYSGVYFAGSEIRGRIECYFNDEITVRGIKIRIKCKEHNSWSGTQTYTDPLDHKTKTRIITLYGDNQVLYREQMLFGSDSGSTHIARGRHVYPFSFTLPFDIPSTFNGPHGGITYILKAVVDKPMSIDYEDDFIFVVKSPIDFNRMPKELQDITSYSDEKSVCCWCCTGGDITMDVELPKIAFVPGETVPFKVTVTNLSNSNVENVKVKFVKTVKYKVNSPHHETKTDEDLIVSFVEHGVGAHGEHTYDLQLAIPPHIEVPNFTKCDLFKAEYELKVSAEMPTCTMDLDVSAWDIQMGHVQIAPQYGGNNFTPAAVAFNGPPPQPYAPPPQPYPPTEPGGSWIAPGMPPPAPGAYPVFPPGYPSEKGGGPPGPPSAPGASMASAPMEDNPKAREAAGDSGKQFPSPGTEMPPPSYNQIHPSSNPPYPPQ